MRQRQLLGGAAAAALMAAYAGHAQAQDAGALGRTWVGEVPASAWTDPARAGAFVSRAPRDAAETRRLEAAMDHVLARYPDGGRRRGLQAVLGRSFQPAQAPDMPVVVVLRMTDAPFAFGGACGSDGDSQFITAPAAWFDGPRQGDWLEQAPELSLATAIGFRQVRDYCDEVAGLGTTASQLDSASPARRAINGLGTGLGFHSLWQSPMRTGEVWNYDSIASLLRQSGAQSFSDTQRYQSPLSLARRYGNLRRVDQPLFDSHSDQVADGGFWALLGANRRWAFLPTLYQTAPDGDGAEATRRWLDEGLKASSDSAQGLARVIPGINWYGLVGHILIPEGGGSGLFSRANWQGAMVEANGAPGCVPVELSLSQPFFELTLQVEAAATNCLAVRWTGATYDPELPASFTVIADAGVDADALDGLHLSADQNWSDRLTRETGGDGDHVELHRAAPIIRPGMVVENVQSRQAVKSWEVVFRPDLTFNDGAMTVAFSSFHPDGEDRTRPMNLRLTVGHGGHDARHTLTGATIPQDGDPCEDQQSFTPAVARNDAVPVSQYHIAALDPEDFSINGYFQVASTTPGLQQRLIDCTRIQIALGVEGPGVAGEALRGPDGPGSPTAVCAGNTADLTRLGAQAMAGATGGNLASMQGLERLQPRQIDFGLTARSPITGPGTYPADATASYQDLPMEQRGVQLPTSNYGEGTITVEHAGPGRMRVRYEARFERQECAAWLAGTISGEMETVAALPLTGHSRRAFIQPRPIELFGERMWAQLPVSSRREMERAPRRGEPDPVTESVSPTEAGGSLMLPTCPMTEIEVQEALRRMLEALPPDVAAAYRETFREEPETARIVACAARDQF